MARTNHLLIACAEWKDMAVGEIIRALKDSLSCGGEPQPWRKVFKKGHKRGLIEMQFNEDQLANLERLYEELQEVDRFEVTKSLLKDLKRPPQGTPVAANAKKQNLGPTLYEMVRDKKKSVVYAGTEECDAPSLNERTCPLHEKSYEEQLAMKNGYAATIAKQMTREVFNEGNKAIKAMGEPCDLPAWAYAQYQKGIPVESILPCPEAFRAGYRNKMEFTINWPFDWESKTFRQGKPVVGMVRTSYAFEPIIERVNGNPIIPAVAAEIADKLSDQLEGHPLLKPLQRKNLASMDKSLADEVGNARSLQVRLFPASDASPEAGEQGGKVMITFLFYGNEEEHAQKVWDAAKTMMLSTFSGEGASLGGGWEVGSIYLAKNTTPNDIFSNEDTHECIYGAPFLEAALMGMKFDVNPFSFFQTNIGSTKVLYGKAFEWAMTASLEGKKKVLLLDICCGTGTIGLLAAKILRDRGVTAKVIGVDCVKEAIEGARSNTEKNREALGEAEVEWHADYVERVFEGLMAKETLDAYDEIICIVDPPRVGLHAKVLRAMRDTPLIKRIVYISCNPESLIKDCCVLASSDVFTGEKGPRFPFQPRRAVPCDMFPGTLHTEMVVEFTRVDEGGFICSSTVDGKGKLKEEGSTPTKATEAPKPKAKNPFF